MTRAGHLSVPSTISISPWSLRTVEINFHVWKLLLSFSSNEMLYSQLEPPVWDGPVKVDIVEFSEGNLINMNECAVRVFVEYYRQAEPIVFWVKTIYYVMREMVRRCTKEMRHSRKKKYYHSHANQGPINDIFICKHRDDASCRVIDTGPLIKVLKSQLTKVYDMLFQIWYIIVPKVLRSVIPKVICILPIWNSSRHLGGISDRPICTSGSSQFPTRIHLLTLSYTWRLD